MRVVMFVHSLVSDWNHGNAHFLRGVASELIAAGHAVDVLEPADGWSRTNLRREQGAEALRAFSAAYPQLSGRTYNLATLDLDEALDGADLVLVHEWNPPELVRRCGEHRRNNGGYRVLFHDTHHRSVTEPNSLAAVPLEEYDGVLAFGSSVATQYRKHGWGNRVWIWHEAADTRLFRPSVEAGSAEKAGDLVWVGNWGDDERSAEIREFLVEPCRELALQARVYGVRYPAEAQTLLREAGMSYEGWTPNFAVPGIFSLHRCTVHIPRRPYARALPGVPTIRMFEALACGIPLVSAPWNDDENLFRPGKDFLYAADGGQMKQELQGLSLDPQRASALAASGLQTIQARHTCHHRVQELMNIYDSMNPRPSAGEQRTA